MDKLPKANIAIIGVVIAQIGGFIFWGANILRDISDNSEKIDMLLEVLVETEDDLMLVDERLQEDLDENTIKLVNEYYTRMIQMEGRGLLRRTVDYLLNSSRHDNGKMIDPATAIALATAFSGIKKAVSAGKEISELGKDLSNFGKAVSDLDYLGSKAKDPPLWKKVSPGLIPALLRSGPHSKTKRNARRVARIYQSLLWAKCLGKHCKHRSRAAQNAERSGVSQTGKR